jgi:hypothetical protein
VTFSYTLFLALLLLAPGLAAWAGLRLAERTDILSPAPEKPGSTFSLFVIVLGTLAGHIFMASLFAVQSIWCAHSSACFQTASDPNIYRVILTGSRTASAPSDLGLLWWFVALLVPALAVFLSMRWIGQLTVVRAMLEQASFGWLNPLVQAAKPANSFILAYVVTTVAHEGSHVAYEGIVEQVAFDENRAITMLVLSRCDRFLVKVSGGDVARVDTKHQPIPLIQLDARNFANVALEVFEVRADR